MIIVLPLQIHLRLGFYLLLHWIAILVYYLTPVAVVLVHSEAIVPDAPDVMHYLILHIHFQTSHG